MNIEIKRACSLFNSEKEKNALVCLIIRAAVNLLTLVDHAWSSRKAAFCPWDWKKGEGSLGAGCAGRGDGRIKADKGKIILVICKIYCHLAKNKLLLTRNSLMPAWTPRTPRYVKRPSSPNPVGKLRRNKRFERFELFKEQYFHSKNLASVLHGRFENFHFELHSIHFTLLGMWCIRYDWWKLTNGSDVMSTTSHRVFQTRERDRGSSSLGPTANREL